MKLLSESERGIPHDNLRFLGNYSGDDFIPYRGEKFLSNYMPVGWENSRYNRKFEHYMIELFHVWKVIDAQ